MSALSMSKYDQFDISIDQSSGFDASCPILEWKLREPDLCSV